MKHYRCKCGRAESLSDDSPWDCEGCDECNTTLAENPSGHRTPIPHDFVYGRLSTTDIAKVFWCKRCYRVKKSPEGTLVVDNETI